MTAFESALAAVDRPQTTAHLKSNTFWRSDPPIVVDGKVTKGGMLPKQREWWELKTFVKVFVGGYGAGKTFHCSKRAISSALTNAPAPVAIVSPTYPMAKKTVIPTIVDLLEGKRSIYGREFWWSYNGSSPITFTIRFHGRQAKLWILSGEKPISLKGPNLGAAYLDEPFIMDTEVFKQMVARVRHPDAPLQEIGMSGTPEQLNWGYDLCTGGGEDLGAVDVGVVHSSTRDNVTLGDQFVERLEGVFDDKAAAAFIEGQFVNLSRGQVYYSFDPSENVVRMQRPEGAQLGVGMDFNVNPMAFVAFWVYGDHMHIFREFELPNSDTEFACQLLRETFPDLYDIYPDPTGRNRHTNAPGGKTDFYYIKQAGFRVNSRTIPGEPRIKDRYNAANGKFKARNGRVTLTVDPGDGTRGSGCPKLIKYLSIYTHEGINKPDHKAMSHLLDSFSYPVEYLFPAKKEELVLRKITGY